ncbi:MAG: HTH domain-containing protein [Nanoarchaeota archaeon]|nr:HTH domain-containing protein [Nanoarchaeota archaeon]
MKIEIVEDTDKRRAQDRKYIADVLSGKTKIDKKRAERTIIVTPEVFTRIFSPERIRLMLKIKRNHIRNIYQLAKELNRKYEAVHRDIKYLEGIGIIQLKQNKRERIPVMYEPISIPEFATGETN